MVCFEHSNQLASRAIRLIRLFCFRWMLLFVVYSFKSFCYVRLFCNHGYTVPEIKIFIVRIGVVLELSLVLSLTLSLTLYCGVVPFLELSNHLRYNSSFTNVLFIHISFVKQSEFLDEMFWRHNESNSFVMKNKDVCPIIGHLWRSLSAQGLESMENKLTGILNLDLWSFSS